MRSLSAFARPTAALVSLCALAALTASAQTFAAGVATQVPSMIIADNSVERISVPAHRHGSEDKLIYARVRDGVYSVDGMVAKIRLNYDVQGAHYMYLFVPGVGTAVLSVAPDADAIATPATLHTNELSFTVDEHRFILTGVALESDKGQPPAHLYVRLDRSAWRLSRLPMVGFGSRAQMPYEWPGALPQEHAEESFAVPPMPASLLPSPAALTPTPQSPATVKPVTLMPVVMR